MKKTTFALAILLGIASTAFSQADTLSTNIYQQNGKLGIGTSTPKVGLNIVDRIDPSGDRALIRVKNLDDSNRSSVSIALESFDETTGTALTHTSSSYTAIPDFNDMGTISTNGNGFSIYSTSDYGSIRFYTNREGSNILERMRIDALGKVGIGTGEPQAKLEVAEGDIYISDIEKGIIMKSPDGQCWRGVLDNSGSLIFTQVPCPGEEEIPSKVSEQWSSSLNIYPNPSDALITIELNDHFPMSTEYKIYGINGNLIDGGNIHSSKQDISVSGLEKGTYVLAILNDLGNRMDSQKLIVK